MLSFQQSLGIDIREDRLRLVLLAKTFGGYKLQHHLIQPITVSSSSSADMQKVLAEYIVGFCRKHRAKPQRVVLGIPQKEALFRCVTIPAVKLEDVYTLLEYEIERHFPFRKEDVYFDYIIVSQEKEAMRALLVAVPRERVIFYQSVLEQARLKCNIIEVESVSVSNLLRSQQQLNGAASELLINLENRDWEMSLFQAGKMVLSHTVSLEEKEPSNGTDSKMEALVEALLEEGSAPAEVNDDIQAKDLDSPESIYQRLRDEIAWFKKGFQAGNNPAWHLVFLGPGDLTQFLANAFKENDKFQARIANPCHQIRSYLDALPERHELSPALALAIRGVGEFPDTVNMLPSGLRQERTNRKSLVATAILAGLLLILGSANGAVYYLRRSRALETIQGQIKSLDPKLAEIAEMEKRCGEISEQLASLSGVRSGYLMLDVLKEITSLLPDGAWLEQFSYRDEEIDIAGQAEYAANLISLLDGSPMFENVRFTAAVTTREGEKERFRIKMEITGSAKRKAARAAKEKKEREAAVKNKMTAKKTD